MITLLCSIAACVWLLDALRLRARAKALKSLTLSLDPPAPEHRFIVRPGVTLDEDTRRSASAYARAQQLDVVDLIPRDLPAWRLSIFLQCVEPLQFRSQRLAKGHTAGEALLVNSAVLERLGYTEEPVDPVAFAALSVKLKQYACTSMDFAVAPSLRAGPHAFLERKDLARWLFGDLAFPVAVAQLAFALVSPLFSLVAGSVALGVLHLQCLLTTLGTALHPRDRVLHTLLRAPLDLLSLLTWLWPRKEEAAIREQRPIYQQLLAQGTARFFEPRRSDCPVCQSASLVKAFSTGDRYQFKPGVFTLERCKDCGHVFQNPRLSIEGLEFYYRDFYDGLGAQRLSRIFSSNAQPYRERAKIVDGTLVPARWLDVGAGHGHFCCAAREIWPQTRFDGLDLSESIDAAEKRGWIDRGYRGLFPDLALDLKGQYDVVSMSHYLEHTREPALEIEAAAQVVAPQGHLFIEVPDPDSHVGRLLGSYWLPWFQPQHQHLLSTRNLERLLQKHGFEPVLWQRGEAHQALDFTFLAFSMLGQVARPIDLPWRPSTPLALRIWHRLVWWLGVPVLAAAWLLDHLAAPLFRRERWSNTYRVLARRRHDVHNELSQEAAQ